MGIRRFIPLAAVALLLGGFVPSHALNVKEFGAKGDGTTNDAAAIQAALDAVPTGAPIGGVVFFPAGTYLIGSTLLVGDNTTLIGPGKSDIVTIKGNNLPTALLAGKNAAATRRFNIHLRDLQFDNTSEATAGGIGVDFHNVTEGSLNHVRITRVETGFRCGGAAAYYTLILNTTSSKTVTGYALNATCNDTRIIASRVELATTGIHINGAGGVQIVASSIEGYTGRGVWVQSGSDVTMIGNRFDTTAASIAHVDVAASVVRSLSMSNSFQGTGAVYRIGAGADVRLPGLGVTARVFNSANISLAHNTETALTFNSEQFDPVNVHSTVTNPGRLTIPAPARCTVIGQVSFAANAAGVRRIGIRLNGVTVLAYNQVPNNSGPFDTIMVVSTLYNFATDDYVELVAFQDSGGVLNAQSISRYSPDFSVQCHE